MSRKGNYPIPVGPDGAIVTYFQSYLPHKMIPNQEFVMRLRFSHFTRGRSSALSIFLDDSGRQWPVFLTCLHDIIPHLRDGIVSGTWTGTKRGENYSLMLVKAD